MEITNLKIVERPSGFWVTDGEKVIEGPYWTFKQAELDLVMMLSELKPKGGRL